MNNAATANTSHWAPDIGDILFVLIISLPLMMLPYLLFNDGSTGWHLVTGNYILDNHTVPTHDLFSYTFPNKPWVAYEWLSDAIMAALVRLGGLNLLAVAVSSSIGLLFLLLYDRCRKEGCHFFTVLVIAIIGALTSAVHWLARPHLFTFFGVLTYSFALDDHYRGKSSLRRLLITLALYMVLWVNCHPAFLLGFALILIYLFSSLIAAAYYQTGAARTKQLDLARNFGIALAVSVLSSFCNPYGVQLYTYIATYLRGSSVLAATDEFLSPVFHFGLHATCLELLFAIFIIGLAISKNKLHLPKLMTCLAFSHLALSAVRNLPLFVIVVLPAIAQLYARTILDVNVKETDGELSEQANVTAGKLWINLAKGWTRFGDGIDDMEWQCKMHLVPILAVVSLSVVAIMGGKVFGTEILSSTFNPTLVPVKALDYLVSLEKTGKLHADKGFNYDNWGGYINYKTGQRVFIDDRADFYGERFYFDYSIISQVLPGWVEQLKKDNIEWVLTPLNSRLAQALINTEHWQTACKDEGSYLLIRPGIAYK